MNSLKIGLRIFILVLSAFSAGRGYSRDLTNNNGKVYRQVTVLEVKPDGIKARWQNGGGFLRFSVLPDDVKREFGYDPDGEKQYMAEVEVQQQNKEANAQRITQLVDIYKENKECALKVIQVTEGGALVSGKYYFEQEYEEPIYRTETRKQGMAGTLVSRQVLVRREKRTRLIWYDLPDVIFVVGVPSHVVDQDSYRATIYPCGRHQYVNVMGAQKTVERYALDPQVAFKLATGTPFHKENEIVRKQENDGPANIKAFGSGFFISQDGYLLTSYHVVQDAATILIRNGGMVTNATLVAHDAKNISRF